MFLSCDGAIKDNQDYMENIAKCGKSPNIFTVIEGYAGRVIFAKKGDIKKMIKKGFEKLRH